MSDQEKGWTRRQFLKVVSVTAGGAVLTITGVFPARAQDLFTGVFPDEEDPVSIVNGITTYLLVVALKLKPRLDRTRLMVEMQFTDNTINGAQMHLTLYDASYAVVGDVIHTEYVGPDTVTTQYAKGRHNVTYWDDPRGIWFTFPQSAGTAESFRLEITAV